MSFFERLFVEPSVARFAILKPATSTGSAPVVLFGFLFVFSASVYPAAFVVVLVVRYRSREFGYMGMLSANLRISKLKVGHVQGKNFRGNFRVK